jgi:hypothetical protein
VIDRAAHRARALDAAGSFGREACIEMDADDDTVRFGGSVATNRVYVASGRQGVLRVSDLDSGACADVVIPVADRGDDLGAPQESGGRVFVPNYSDGTVTVVDVDSARVATTDPVVAAGRTFDLFDHDGRAFYNDPATEHAGVIRIDGEVSPVAKYDPADPGSGVEPAAGRDRPPAAPPPTPPPTEPPADEPEPDPEPPVDQRPARPDETRPVEPGATGESTGTADTAPGSTAPADGGGTPPTTVGPPSTTIPDADGDGVPDGADQCPGSPDDANGDGMPDCMRDTTPPAISGFGAANRDIGADGSGFPCSFPLVTEVWVSVTDDSEIASVRLMAYPPQGPIRIGMVAGGSVWQATLGPVYDPRMETWQSFPLTWSVEANDVWGNIHTVQADFPIVVHGCAVIIG